jgi:hypothetical protein
MLAAARRSVVVAAARCCGAAAAAAGRSSWRAMATVSPQAPSETAPRAFRFTLTEHERRAVGAAKDEGFLRLAGPGMSSAATSVYWQYCHAARRPYLAIGPRGEEVAVDANTVSGVGAKRQVDVDTWIAAARVALAEVARTSRVQVVRAATMEAQAKAVVPGKTEGEIAHRKPDAPADLDDAFTVYTDGRAASERVAAQLYGAYVAAFAHRSAADRAAAAATTLTVRRAVRRRQRLRRLAALVADPIRVKNLRVAAGAVDGFVSAQRRGAIAAEVEALSAAIAAGGAGGRKVAGSGAAAGAAGAQ